MDGDYEIRSGVVSHLLQQGFARQAIRHEIPMDTASSGGRADIVLLAQERLIGLELKSAKDNLDRCDSQWRSYSLAFDSAALVIDRKHLAKVDANMRTASHWPNTVSFSVSDGLTKTYGGSCVLLVEAGMFPSRSTSAYRMASLLWQTEAVSAAAKSSLHCSTRTKAIQMLAEYVPLHELRQLVSSELRDRVPNKWESAFWTRFDADGPSEILAATVKTQDVSNISEVH